MRLPLICTAFKPILLPTPMRPRFGRASEWRRPVILVALALMGITAPRSAAAAPMRTFLMSCAYGTGAGAVVGLTTLAFSDRPSENLSQVAKGASLGLYVGIGVGLYLASQPEASTTGGLIPFLGPTPDGGATVGFITNF